MEPITPDFRSLVRNTSTGDLWVVCAVDTKYVYLAGTIPLHGPEPRTVKTITVTLTELAKDYTSV